MAKGRTAKQMIQRLLDSAQAAAMRGDKERAAELLQEAERLKIQLPFERAADEMDLAYEQSSTRAGRRRLPAGGESESRALAKRPSASAFQKIRDAAGQRASQAADWAAKKIDERDLGGLAKRTGPPEPRGRIKGAKSAYQKKLRLEGIAAARSKRLEAEAPWLVKQLKKRPGATALGAGNLALMFGPQLVKSLRDELNIGGYMDEQTDRLIGAQAELNSYARMQRRREEELNRLMQVNTAMLAQRSPELYNQIMAGRRLPQQATVIGGQPREDLLREVARGMSEGRYTEDTAG